MAIMISVMDGWANMRAAINEGLSTVIGIVEEHGGFVLVDTHVGRGTILSAFLHGEPDSQDPPGETTRFLGLMHGSRAESVITSIRPQGGWNQRQVISRRV